MKGIAYLGPQGTYSHEAATIWGRLTGQDLFLACPDLPEVLAAVRDSRAVAAVLPVENSIEGAVNLTLDLILETPELQVTGEVVLPIHHCLISRAGNLAAIKEVWSHPQALAQCRHYLAQNLPGVAIKPTTSTAAAASQAQQRPDLAAIASTFAAGLYQVPLVATEIEDYPDNKTRFWILGQGTPKLPGPYKTSLVVAAVANRPGSLYAILKDFAEAGINLTRIESRPTKQELGEYLFFIDCEGKATDSPLKDVLAGLKNRTSLLLVLGSYTCNGGADYER
ncbi:prephenate dehydratase [Moorella naiadis]|uniref:prephenate dehydratase n=1 Tax=Moorella naiadis (nom. illeg.) TaxID=3093670 RepID=UPI003D9C7DEB